MCFYVKRRNLNCRVQNVTYTLFGKAESFVVLFFVQKYKRSELFLLFVIWCLLYSVILFWKTTSSDDDHVLLFEIFREHSLQTRDSRSYCYSETHWTIGPLELFILQGWHGKNWAESNIYIYMFTPVLLPTYALCVYGYHVLIWSPMHMILDKAMHADKSRLTDIHLSSNSYKEAMCVSSSLCFTRLRLLWCNGNGIMGSLFFSSMLLMYVQFIFGGVQWIHYKCLEIEG